MQTLDFGALIRVVTSLRKGVTRRSVVTALSAFTMLAAAGFIMSSERVARSLYRLFGGCSEMQRVGRVFHSLHPGGATQLAASLARLDDDHALLSALIALRKTDFAAGRVVVLNGWVMAVTEAQVCALLSRS